MLTEETIMEYLNKRKAEIDTEIMTTCAFMDLRAYNSMIVRQGTIKSIIEGLERLSKLDDLSKEMKQ